MPAIVSSLRHAALACGAVVALTMPACAADRAATPADYGFSTPSPKPPLPAAFDRFAPPFRAPATGAPQIAEALKTAGPNETIVASGSGLSNIPRFSLFTQKLAGKGRQLRVQPIARDTFGAAVRIPRTVAGWSMYLLWPENARGVGKPIAINRTDAWWVGPQPGVLGGTSSVFGRNLSYGNGTKQAWVYLKKINGAGRWMPTLRANPYRVDFRIPAAMEAGEYEVWAHNGHGGDFGWSGPLRITLSRSPWEGQASRTFNVRDYGARGDGRTDDEAAIQRALDAAGRSAPSTVYFPPGTYMVSKGFLPPNNVRWLGAGRTNSVIRARSNFSRSDARGYALLFGENAHHANNIELRGLTFDQAGNPGRTGFPVWFRWVRNVRFTGVRIISRPGPYFNLEHSRQIHISRSAFIGDGGALADARQVFLDRSGFRLTNNANTALSTRGSGGEVAITNNTIRDYDSSTPEGTAAGRFFVSQPHSGATRHYYFSGNRTIDLAPPPQRWPRFDPNAGEQILFEQCCAGGIDTIASASANTFRLNGFSGEFDVAKPTDIMVNWGPGVGQVRRIVGYNRADRVFTIDRPWNVTPAPGTNVTLASTASKIVIYNNRFDGKSAYATMDTASSAVQLYSNSTDIIADGNTITNMRGGIEFWAHGNRIPEMNSVYFNVAVNNIIRNSYDAFADYTMYLDAPIPNTIGHFGNIRRGNRAAGLTNAGISIRTWADHTGGGFSLNVFERNRFANTQHGVIAGNLHVSTQTPLENTILSANIFNRGTARHSGSMALMAPAKSTWVILNSTWKGFERHNPQP